MYFFNFERQNVGKVCAVGMHKVINYNSLLMYFLYHKYALLDKNNHFQNHVKHL
jgi:hypothetical protein